MKAKLSFLMLALFGIFGLAQAQCTKTQTAQTVFSTPGVYTVGLSGVGQYIQIFPNVMVYDTLGSNQRQYYLLPGAQLILKNCFSQFVYMQGNSSVTRYGSGGNNTTIYYETTATINGTAMVSTNSCTAVSFPTVSCSSSTGIKEYMQEDLLKVFPNPANGFVNVINDHAEQMIATIVNSIGKIERVVVLSTGLNSIDLYGMAEGIYFINVSANDGTVARGKIVVTQ
jgi:hypothetical protein